VRRQPRRGAVAALSAEKGTVYGGTKERRRPFLEGNRSYRPEGPGNPYRPLRPVRRRLPLTELNPRRSSFPCPAKTTGKMPMELMGKMPMLLPRRPSPPAPFDKAEPITANVSCGNS